MILYVADKQTSPIAHVVMKYGDIDVNVLDRLMVDLYIKRCLLLSLGSARTSLYSDSCREIFSLGSARISVYLGRLV